MASFVEIGQPLPEKIFEGFYHIWAWRPSLSCPGLFIDTLVPPSYGCFIQNLALIAHAVSEMKIFENGERRRTTDGRRVPAYTISSPVSLRLR